MQVIKYNSATPTYQNQTQQLPQPDAKAEAWADKNDWFGEDRIRTLAAFTIHERFSARRL